MTNVNEDPPRFHTLAGPFGLVPPQPVNVVQCRSSLWDSSSDTQYKQVFTVDDVVFSALFSSFAFHVYSPRPKTSKTILSSST